MVDFQERDTRRSLGDDDDSDDDSGEAEADVADGDEATGENPDADGVAAGESDNPDSATADHATSDRATSDHDTTDHDHSETRDHHAADRASVSAAILTVSTSRSIEADASGDAIVGVLEDEGHEIATRELVNDDYDGVQSAVDALVSRGDVDVVITTGGTGVAPEDVTVEAVRPLFEKELPGFGELFREQSREEIGPRAIASRAVAGIADGVPVFCLPGSESAVRLGTVEVIVPVVGHLVGLSRPHEVERQR